jgi:cell division septation protein DedD
MPRSRTALLLLAGALAALPLVRPTTLAAQRAPATRTATGAARDAVGGAAAPSDPELARAYALVIDGQGRRGRAIVDSLLAAAPANSARYAEVLYWRAAFAASTADAERDYRRLSVEYPLSNRAADALVALAQLEYVRGDTTLAVHHLQRLMIEHPAGVRSAKANFWAASALLTAGDMVRACSALRAARATAGADDGALRNQIEEELPRCGAGAVASVAREAPGARDRAAAPVFAVQVAAYRSRAEADALAAKLGARGYAARVVAAEGAPFRVHVGRYATRAAAVAALERVRAARLTGFVVQTGAR